MSFATDGYEIRPLLSADQVACLRDVIGSHMDRVSRSLCRHTSAENAEASFDRRIEMLAQRDLSLARLFASAVTTDGHRGDTVARLVSDTGITELVSTLTGTEVESSRFRFRVSSPSLPDCGQLWRSDAVRSTGPCSNIMATVWVALNEPAQGIGALEIVPGKRSSPLPHNQMNGKLFIPSDRLRSLQKVTPQVPAGNCLIMAPFTPHRSAANASTKTRWNLVIWLNGKSSAFPGKPIRETLARNLKQLRRDRGMTQHELAAASGLDRAYISALEQQRHGARIDTIAQLAAALDVESSELLAAHCLGS